jgi:hypothetical protein
MSPTVYIYKKAVGFCDIKKIYEFHLKNAITSTQTRAQNYDYLKSISYRDTIIGEKNVFSFPVYPFRKVINGRAGGTLKQLFHGNAATVFSRVAKLGLKFEDQKTNTYKNIGAHPRSTKIGEIFRKLKLILVDNFRIIAGIFQFCH